MVDHIAPNTPLPEDLPRREDVVALAPSGGRIYEYEVYRHLLPDAPDPSPVREARAILDDTGNQRYVNRLLVGTPTTGKIWMQWAAARYGAIVPTNWSMVSMVEYIHSYIPMRYELADAQNLIVKQAVEGDFEWLLLLEQDNLIPVDTFLRLNYYVRDGRVPVVSGLYYTKNVPTEPLVYRGRGTGAYTKFEVGDLVWCDGVPTGCLLIHCSILRAMWADAEAYDVPRPDGSKVRTRRVFISPRDVWFDPESAQFNTNVGTTDLRWCTDVIKGEYLAKAGWTAIQQQEYPFLVDTNWFIRHIDDQGRIYPDYAIQEIIAQRKAYEARKGSHAEPA